MSTYPAKVTSRYQVVIPKNIREVLKLNLGDYLLFEIKENETIVIKKGKFIEKEDDG